MRPVLPGDVVAAGCALLAVRPGRRHRLLRQMISAAERADAHRIATGHAHPRWGNGSLMATAMSHPRLREPFLDDPDYAACLVMVLNALRGRKA